MMQANVQVLLITDFVEMRLFARYGGTYRIASELRAAGYTVQVLDHFTRFSVEELEQIFAHVLGPASLLVGFGSTFFQRVEPRPKNVPASEYQKRAVDQMAGREFTSGFPYWKPTMTRVFAAMRAHAPQIKIAFGGAKAQIFKAMGVDAFFTGYAEKSLLEYLQYIQGKLPFFQFERLSSGAMHVSERQTGWDFQNSRIDWHHSDNIESHEVLPIEIARGCIFRCKFCSFSLNGKSKNDYIKNASVLREEFIRNQQEFGVTRYIFTDDTHNDNTHKLLELRRVLDTLDFSIEFVAYLRHDLLATHPEQFELLRVNGLRAAVFGIETMNHASGKAIGKGMHPERTKELLAEARARWPDTLLSSGFICGLPRETEETFHGWMSWLMQPDNPLHNFNLDSLHMNLGDNKIYKSEFEQDPTKFGYTFNEQGDWHNGAFDRQWAIRTCLEYNTQSRQRTERCKIGGFGYMMMYNQGFTRDQLFGTAVKNMPADSQLRLNQFHERYVKKVLHKCGG